jgi:PPOX class probable F420-dependent enzyme
MRLPDATIEGLLDTWPVARLATVGRAGRPHLIPLVFARVRGVLWSPIDATPKAAGELARVAHLRANPAASLLLDAYDEDWTRLWWLRVDASGQVVERAAGNPEVEAALAALRAKYPQYQRVPVLRDPPTLLALHPLGISSWCAGEGAVPIC